MSTFGGRITTNSETSCSMRACTTKLIAACAQHSTILPFTPTIERAFLITMILKAGGEKREIARL